MTAARRLSDLSVPASCRRLAVAVLLGHLGDLLLGRKGIGCRFGQVDRVVGARLLGRVRDAQRGLALGAIGGALRPVGPDLDRVTLPFCALSLAASGRHALKLRTAADSPSGGADQRRQRFLLARYFFTAAWMVPFI